MIIPDNSDLANYNLDIKVPERDLRGELRAIIASAPSSVWEKIGYKNIVSVNAVDGDYKNIIFVNIQDSVGRSADLVYSVYDYDWKLAECYKPYSDFCMKLIKSTVEVFSRDRNFVALFSDPTMEIIEALNFCQKGNMFDKYFTKFRMQDDFVEYCLNNNINGLYKIIELKYKWVLHNFIICINDANNKDYDKHRLLMEKMEYNDLNKFCTDFLMQYYDVRNWDYIMQEIEEDIRGIVTDKKFYILKNMGGVKSLQQQYFSGKYYDRSIDFFRCYCTSFLEEMYKIFISIPADEIMNRDEISEARKDIIRYFKSTADFYHEKCSVPFDMVDYEVTSEKDPYSDRLYFTAKLKDLNLSSFSSYSKERAINDLREEYNNTLSSKVIDKIIDNYNYSSFQLLVE